MSSATFGRLFFTGISLTGLYLGTWQVERYNWKKDKILKEKDAFQTNAHDIQFNFNNTDSTATRQRETVTKLEQEYTGKRVLLKGKFIPDHDILLGLRSVPLSNGRKKAEGMAVNPQGYFVITPFRLESYQKLVSNSDSDTSDSDSMNPIVYINRGWIPMKNQGYSIPNPGTVKELECVVAAKEKGSVFSPPNEWKTRKLVWLENEAIVLINNDLHPDMIESADQVNIVNCNLVVEKDLELESHPTIAEKKGKDEEIDSKKEVEEAVVETVGGMKDLFVPIPMSLGSNLQEHYVTPEMHVAYAFTWFSLAIFSAGFGYYRFRPLAKKAISHLKKT